MFDYLKKLEKGKITARVNPFWTRNPRMTAKGSPSFDLPNFLNLLGEKN